MPSMNCASKGSLLAGMLWPLWSAAAIVGAWVGAGCAAQAARKAAITLIAIENLMGFMVVIQVILVTSREVVTQESADLSGGVAQERR